MLKSDTFTVIYYTGGTESGSWNRIFDLFETREAAQVVADREERRGYPCMIKVTRELNAIGMPEGAPRNR